MFWKLLRMKRILKLGEKKYILQTYIFKNGHFKPVLWRHKRKKSSFTSIIVIFFWRKRVFQFKKGRKYWLLWTKACKLRRDCVRNWFVLLIKINYILSHQEGLKIQIPTTVSALNDRCRLGRLQQVDKYIKDFFLRLFLH